MDNENTRLFKGLFNGYIGTTIDTNFVSNYWNVYYLWTIKEINDRSIEIAYLTRWDEKPTMIRIEKNNRELIELVKVLRTYQKERQETTKNLLNKFTELLLRDARDPRTLSQIKKGLAMCLFSSKSIEKMGYKDLEKYIMNFISIDKILLLDNDNYIKGLAKYYIPEFYYRDFYYIKNYEVYELLRHLRIDYNNNSKITGQRGKTIVSSYNQKIILDDPFYSESQVDKTIYETKTRTVREWIPQKIVREWDGMDNSGYYVPGHYESNEEKYEDTTTKTELFSNAQTKSMQEYCLEKSLVPRWMMRDDKLQNSKRLY